MTTSRTFTAFDLVRLPRLDANTAQSLASAIIAAAEKIALSDGAKEALEAVAKALKGIIEASGAHKLKEAPKADGPSKLEADSALDSAWVGTYDWLSGWARLPEAPKAEIARELRDRLFPDGLKFTRYAFTKQWAESNTRMSLIDEAKLDKIFEELGGNVFLESLRATHRVYGDVLGLTKAKEDEAARAERIRDALDHLANSLRAYILQVVAMVRPSDPEGQAKVDKLLAPVATWQSSASAKASPAQPPVEAPPPPADTGDAPC